MFSAPLLPPCCASPGGLGEAGTAGPPPDCAAEGALAATADPEAAFSTMLVRWGLPEPDMALRAVVLCLGLPLLLLFLVPDLLLVVVVFLFLLSVLPWMEEEDGFLDVGGTFEDGAGLTVAGVAAFRAGDALLLVVGTADIDAMWNT